MPSVRRFPGRTARSGVRGTVCALTREATTCSASGHSALPYILRSGSTSTPDYSKPHSAATCPCRPRAGPALAVEVDGGGIEEQQVEIVEMYRFRFDRTGVRFGCRSPSL